MYSVIKDWLKADKLIVHDLTGSSEILTLSGSVCDCYGDVISHSDEYDDRFDDVYNNAVITSKEVDLSLVILQDYGAEVLNEDNSIPAELVFPVREPSVCYYNGFIGLVARSHDNLSLLKIAEFDRININDLRSKRPYHRYGFSYRIGGGILFSVELSNEEVVLKSVHTPLNLSSLVSLSNLRKVFECIDFGGILDDSDLSKYITRDWLVSEGWSYNGSGRWSKGDKVIIDNKMDFPNAYFTYQDKYIFYKKQIK